MSHDEDHYFQCRDFGHIACHCPNVQCSKCDKYGYIVMDCPHRIPPSGTPAHHHRPKSHNRHHTRSTSWHHPEDRYRCSRSRSKSHPCRYHSRSCHDSYRGCSGHTMGTADAITGALHDTHTQMPIHITLTRTLHIEDHLLIGALQFTLKRPQLITISISIQTS